MREAIFGSFDGMTSALGVVAAAYVTSSAHVLVIASICLAIASAVSMAGGMFLSEQGVQKDEMQRAGVMAGATFAGSFLPAVPFLFAPKPVALVLALVLVCGAAIVIAQVRVPTHGAVRAYAQTLGLLVVAAVLSIGATLAFNGG